MKKGRCIRMEIECDRNYCLKCRGIKELSNKVICSIFMQVLEPKKSKTIDSYHRCKDCKYADMGEWEQK